MYVRFIDDRRGADSIARHALLTCDSYAAWHAGVMTKSTCDEAPAVREQASFTHPAFTHPAFTHRDWDIIVGDGPVIATAIHDGHAIRDSLLPYLASNDEDRRREEDPLTGILTSVGDTRIRVRSSRFEVDLNRPRDKAISADPADTWGMRVWKDSLPQSEIERSLQTWDAWYAMIGRLLDAVIKRWGCAFLLDIHSYNHRRDGADGPTADAANNPDIELGVTTLDPARWRGVADRFGEELRRQPVAGRELDVRENVRFPTGGEFPEWVFAQYGDRVCTISPEYKKIFMDEWSGRADIAAIDELRSGLERAVAAVRGEFENVSR